MRWRVTHTGWLLMCPVLLAELETEAPVPMPRWRWLGFWLEFNIFLYDVVNFVVSLINPLMCGYLFTSVKPLEEPMWVEYEVEE